MNNWGVVGLLAWGFLGKTSRGLEDSNKTFTPSLMCACVSGISGISIILEDLTPIFLYTWGGKSLSTNLVMMQKTLNGKFCVQKAKCPLAKS